jgi:hypothetical protein
MSFPKADVQRLGSEAPAEPQSPAGNRWVTAVYCGGAGTSPYLDMTPISFSRSGGPPAFTIVPTSRKYWAPMSGVMTISARAVPLCGLLK